METDMKKGKRMGGIYVEKNVDVGFCRFHD